MRGKGLDRLTFRVFLSLQIENGESEREGEVKMNKFSGSGRVIREQHIGPHRTSSGMLQPSGARGGHNGAIAIGSVTCNGFAGLQMAFHLGRGQMTHSTRVVCTSDDNVVHDGMRGARVDDQGTKQKVGQKKKINIQHK